MLAFSRIKLDILNALKVIRYKPVLSALSGVGVSIGTLALVAMMSISEGALQQAEAAIALLGVDTVRIESRLSTASDIGADDRSLAKPLNEFDIILLQRILPEASFAGWQRLPKQSLKSDSNIVQGSVLRVSDGWFSAENIDLSTGRALTYLDNQQAAQVCVLGRQLAVELQVALFDVVNWQQTSCRVVGILAPVKGQRGAGTELTPVDLNRVLIMTLPGQMIASRGLDGITARLHSNEPQRILKDTQTIREALTVNHVAMDYVLVSPLLLLEKAKAEQQTFSIIMGSIAGLSLLVGGIGIMNVMLANIAEQRREIGLRLACGATPQDIVQMYLIYAVVLCGMGTLVGVLIGVLAGLAIQWWAQWPVHFSIFGMAIGPFWAMACGAVFGTYPALQASRTAPTEALRTY